MSEPPSDHGNVVDHDVLARRRARRAEVSEDATLELHLFEAERRLREAAAERDALRARLEQHERDLRATRQREWAEQQQRLEAQGEAAVTREVAAGQVAALRERLAEAEAEVAIVGAERDRVREALEREQAASAGDRERREALEREQVALRAELERRAALASEAASAVAGARADITAAERRLAAEHAAFADRVRAVEGAVAAVRERLGAAVGALRERLAAERSAREVAEEAVVAERDAAQRARLEAAWFQDELRRRVQVEAQLRTALDELRGELEAVRAGDAERVARLAAQVEAVIAIAQDLRDGVARAASAETEALTASLSAMQARVAELQQGVAAAAGVRAALEAERAARWVAEAELEAERRRGEADRAARADAEARLAEVEAELDDLRATARPSAPDPGALASLRATLEELRAAEPARASEPALALDLAAAAARLRSMAEPAPDHASRDDSCTNSARESSLDAPEAPDAPAPEPAAAPEPIGAAAPAPAAAPIRSPLPAHAPVTPGGPWLRDALVALAADEPETAERMLLELLPAQGGLAKHWLTYDLEITGGATHRVAVDVARARVEAPGDAPAPARVTGPLAALIPLGTGGAGRRLPGTKIAGRRHLRRLVKARREPLGLAELAAAGVAPAPELLLAVLVRAVQPGRTAGRPLSVEVAVEGAERWRIVASGEAPPALVAGAGADDPPDATLHVAAGRLAAVLAGTAAAEDGWVEGDVRAVRTLLSWLDRAQRGER